MADVVSLRAKAVQVRALASQASNPGIGLDLLKLATQFERLATESEQWTDLYATVSPTDGGHSSGS